MTHYYSAPFRPEQGLHSELTASVFVVTYSIYYHVKSETAHSCMLWPCLVVTRFFPFLSIRRVFSCSSAMLVSTAQHCLPGWSPSPGMTGVLCWVDLDRPPTAEDSAVNSLFVQRIEQMTPQNQSFSSLLNVREKLYQLCYTYGKVFQTQNHKFSWNLTASGSQV